MQSTRPARNRKQAGFTLVELMVAITVFAIIALAAYAIYDAAQWTFKRGSEASDAQQRTRIGFDRMTSDIRLAGYDYNADGDQTPYSDSADEQLEYLSPTAIVFRANFDYEDAQRGREYDPAKGPPSGTDAVSGNATSGFETSVEYLEEDRSRYGFPIVTTGNDEIVVYALTKEGVNDSITFKADMSMPRDGDRNLVGEGADLEEEITLCGLALTHDDPPYTLERITFRNNPPSGIGATGSNCINENPQTSLVTRTPLADGIRSLNFQYYNQSGDDFHCKTVTAGDCADADQVPFDTVLGLDKLDASDTGLTGRAARENVRRISIELVGMTENPDFKYTDPEDKDGPAAQHRKTRLIADVNPPNLGRVGQIDINSVEPGQVQNVSSCSGECGMVRVTWEERPRNENILGYIVNLYEVDCSSTTTEIRKVSTKFVTGRTAYGTSGYLYTIFDGEDDSELLEEAYEDPANRICLAVQVTAKNVFGDDGPASDSNNDANDGEQVTPLSNATNAQEWDIVAGPDIAGTAITDPTVYDETRPGMVSNLLATGIDQSTLFDDQTDDRPDNNGAAISPETDSNDDFYPLVHAIELTWDAPSYAMLEENNEPGTSANAVDAALGQSIGAGSGTVPADLCHADVDEALVLQTPLEEVNGLAQAAEELENLGSIVPTTEKQGRYLVFRSTEPNFQPRDHHLIASVDTTSYTDTTIHHYRTDAGEKVFQYTDAFPVENCVKYYYRVRVADDCWDGENPAGVDPVGGDYRHPNLSPFFPPLNDASTTDSDVLDNPSDTPDAAIAGYARPADSPEKVRNVVLDAFQNGGGGVGAKDKFMISFELPKIDDDASNADFESRHIAVGKFRVWGRKNVNNPESWLPTQDPPFNCGGGPPCGAPDTWFGDIRLHTDPTGAGVVTYEDAGVIKTLTAKQAGIRSLIIGHHDEDGDNALGTNTPPAGWNVELPWEDEAAVNRDGGDGTADDSGDTGMLFEPERGAGENWHFRVVGVQCTDTEAQSFTNNDEDKGILSDWIKIPCLFGQAINGIPADGSGGSVAEDPNLEGGHDNTPSATVSMNCPGSLPARVVANVTDGDGTPPRGCQARLIVTAGVSGDSVSSNWKFWADANCNVIGDSCPDDQSFYSTNEFCWDTDEVEQLMTQVRGQDVSLSVEVRESRPDWNCLPGQNPDDDACSMTWEFPCVGTGDCPAIVAATDCIVITAQDQGSGSTSFNPIMPQDDFTGSVDPISGEPNGLPDGTQDCDQAAQWSFEEACANGDLDITDIDIDWRGETGPDCTGDLLRAFWDFRGGTDGVEIYRSSSWPGSGDVNGNVQTCDTGQGCGNEATCLDPDPTMGCLFLKEGAEAMIRFEFDKDPSDPLDPDNTAQCVDSLKNAELEVDITYLRTTLGGASQTLTQTFTFSPTDPVIPDPCEPCDKDGDKIIAISGNDDDGTACADLAGSGDCDDLDPLVGTPLAINGTCCDLDGDGFLRLGTADDGTLCADPNDSDNVCDSTTDRPGGAKGLVHPIFGPPNIGVADCNDLDAAVRPADGNEPNSTADPKCSDQIDNDCDCFIDGGDLLRSRECSS